MDKDTHVSCPPLPVFRFHEDLVVSSLSTAVGSLVEFLCSGDENKTLSGPSVLLCTTAGKWNGSIPTCIYETEVKTSVLPETTEPTASTTTVSEGELKVETVLVVLWVTGGLLLVTLGVLMACILRSHKKQQRNRSERVSRGQGNPRHGGVNPTFSTYDEIWTWIPVLTDNSGHCRNQNQTSNSARVNSANQTNSEIMRNLRLPTYSEAVSGPTTVTSYSQSRSRPANTAPSNQRSTVPQNISQRQNMAQSNNENRNHGANTTAAAHVHRTVVNVRENRGNSQLVSSSRCQNRESANTNMTLGSSEHHHYETIPADVIAQSNVRANRENSGSVSVTTSSGSALQQARDLVNRYCAHAQHPQPSAPEYPHVSREHMREPRVNNDRHYRSASRANVNPSIEPLRATTSSRAQENRPMSQHYHRYTTNHSSNEFRHSEGSRFEHYADNGHRVRSGMSPAGITEPPPPYSAAREQPRQARAHASGILPTETSSAIAATSLRTGLECQYF